MTLRLFARPEAVAAVAFAFALFVGCSSEPSDSSDTGAATDGDSGSPADVDPDTTSGGTDDAGATSCESGADCTSEDRPYCADDGRCAGCLYDMHCITDNCQNDARPYECECVEVGESCNADRDCCSGECGAGTCRSESCVSTGESCEATTDCCGKTVCNEDGTCEECLAEGEVCEEESDCCGDMSCVGPGGGGMTFEKTCVP